MELTQLVFWIIIGIIILDFGFGKLVSVLNYKWRKKEIPNHIADIYDEKKYQKFQNYSRENFKTSMILSFIMFTVTILMFLTDGFVIIDEFLRSRIESEVFISIAFFSIIALISGLISMPFSVYDTFVIEEKYGFNKTTPKTYILDMIKALFLTVIIGGGLAWVIIKLYFVSENWFWLYAWIVISGFSVFMAEFYSSLIVPLFNKQTPLEEGELRDKISQFADKAGFKLDNIFVINGSKRSTRANAYFTGLGKKKRIVLYDTLINDFTPSEITAVLAHEIGHFKKNHIRKSLIISVLNTGIILYLFGLFVGKDIFSQALGADKAIFHIGAIGFAVLYTPLSTLTGILMNVFSRKNERGADDFAAHYAYSDELIDSLKKLANNNLSNLTPHPLNVFLNYSHPPLSERILRLKSRRKVK